MFSCSHKIIIFRHSTQLDCQQLNTTSFWVCIMIFQFSQRRVILFWTTKTMKLLSMIILNQKQQFSLEKKVSGKELRVQICWAGRIIFFIVFRFQFRLLRNDDACSNKNDAFDATTIDLRRMTWTSYTKTFVRQWKYWALVLCMCVCDIGDATEMLALSYVLCLGGKREFASEILCLLVLIFWGDASWRWCCRCFWGYVWEKEKFTIWFDFE